MESSPADPDLSNDAGEEPIHDATLQGWLGALLSQPQRNASEARSTDIGMPESSGGPAAEQAGSIVPPVSALPMFVTASPMPDEAGAAMPAAQSEEREIQPTDMSDGLVPQAAMPWTGDSSGQSADRLSDQPVTASPAVTDRQKRESEPPVRVAMQRDEAPPQPDKVTVPPAPGQQPPSEQSIPVGPLHNHLKADIEPLREKQPASSQVEMEPPDPVHARADEPAAVSVHAHSWQTLDEGEAHPGQHHAADMNDNNHDQRESSSGQGASTPVQGQHQLSSDLSPFAIGQGFHQSKPAATGLPAGGAAAPAHAAPLPDADGPLPAAARSVVFEVAHADLGRVNVRVAMTNDLVHAHFSSDRSDVGQYLLNGQDRLQTALQANGLDMGQFRVDIDRQSAGRSFHQGPSQDQGRWEQPHHGRPDHDYRPGEPPAAQRPRLQGMLNLVA